MATTDASTPPAPPDGGTPLQIVLFGMPAAGKSSLLGALAQAALSQEHLLHGRLIDPSHGLAELQHRLYADKPRRTSEEIVPYAVRFEPFAAASDGTTDDKLDAVLIDCDGQVANDLLTRRKELNEESPEGTLAREVLDADTLILVVDASAPTSQVDADFAEFGRFLRLFERQRGRQIEVGGLPVFLVLTKCDLLAKPEDTPANWMEHIEETKRQVSDRFDQFLARNTSDDGLPAFGHIDLHLWATAVRRPALVGVAAKPNEPYGVAELFWQCLLSAEKFRQRTRRADRRLVWTLGALTGVVGGLVALIVALTLGFPHARPPSDLEIRIESRRNEPPAVRLQGAAPADIKQKIAGWAELRNDPGFDDLPDKTKALCLERIVEVKDYAVYWERLRNLSILPPNGDQADLENAKDELTTRLAVPRPDEWRQTEAGKLHERELDEVQALLKEVNRLKDWYESRTREATSLLLFSSSSSANGEKNLNWQAWQSKVNDWLAKFTNPPARENDPVDGAPTYTYASLFRLGGITRDRDEWDRTRRRLERLRDLSAALGLGGPLLDRPPVLVIPQAPRFTLSQAGDKLQELQKYYPQFEQDFTLTGLPEAAATELRQAARTQYDLLLEPGREEVLRQLRRAGPEGGESPARWNNIRDWLNSPPELEAWRVLARVLVRLHDPKRPEPDPIKELNTFLARDSFEIDLRRLTLEIPDRLNKRPTDDFTIYLTAENKQTTSLAFETTDRSREAQRGVTRYQLRAAKAQFLVFKPGNLLWASIPLRDTTLDEEWMLTWARSRSEVYEFERLARPPRLHRRDKDNTEGKIVEDVTLTIVEGSLPTVPDLVPVVKLDK